MNQKRSLFFPLALIATGALWLLVNFGYLPAENLWAITRLWPLFLIAAGFGLILRGRGLLPGALLQALVLLAVMGAVLFAPQLGLAGPPDWNGQVVAGFGGGVAGSGQIVTETRSLEGAIDTLQLRYPAEVTFIQGDSAQLQIRADDNLLPQLVARVNGGTLVIENPEDWDARVRPSQLVEIEISLPALQRVELDTAGQLRVSGLRGESFEVLVQGAGAVELHDVQVNRLQARLDGAGTVKASGKVQDLTLVLDGVGSFEGEALASQHATVTVSGVGSATVRAAETLNATIDGLGSIRYYGSPSVQEETDGLGSVNRAGN